LGHESIIKAVSSRCIMRQQQGSPVFAYCLHLEGVLKHDAASTGLFKCIVISLSLHAGRGPMSSSVVYHPASVVPKESRSVKVLLDNPTATVMSCPYIQTEMLW
jgi:hypothetical protein